MAHTRDELLAMLREQYAARAVEYRSTWHREAWALMQYESEDGKHRETLWNSRNGVTPFNIPGREPGVRLLHVRWGEDQICPTYKPQVGMRIFADLQPEDALTIAKAKAAAYADHPVMRSSFARPEDVLVHFVKETYRNGIPPTVVEVDEGMAEREGWTDASEPTMNTRMRVLSVPEGRPN